MRRWKGSLSLAIAMTAALPGAAAAATTGPDLSPYPASVASVAAAAASPAPAAAAPAADPPCTGYYALTFDDGPTNSTPDLLAALKAQGVKATFFVTGQHASGVEDDGTPNPQLVTNLKAEITDGHVIANHSWNHPALINGSNAAYAQDMAQTIDPSTGQPYGAVELSDAQVKDQLDRTNAAIKAAGGPAPQFVRPPYGEWILGTRDLSAPGGLFAQAGLNNTMWTVDTTDAMGTDTAPTPQATIEQIVLNPDATKNEPTLADGGIILMHDGYAETIKALPNIISGLRAKGLCAGKLAVTAAPLQAYNGPFYVRAVADSTTPPPPPADTTKPTITVGTPLDNASYTVGQVVNAAYTCADNVGVTQCAGSVANGSALDTTSAGAKTFTVSAKDAAGNTETITRAYTVNPPPDTAAPTISVASPQESAHYAQGQAAMASYSCTDPSGVASCVGTVANGAVLDTSSAGTKTFKVDATDTRGNATSKTVSYVVDASPPPPEQPPSNPQGPPPTPPAQPPAQQPAPPSQPGGPPRVVPASKPRAPVVSRVVLTSRGRRLNLLTLRGDLRLGFRVDRAASLTLNYRQKVCDRRRRCKWVVRRTERFSVSRSGSYSRTLHRRVRSRTLPVGGYYVYVSAANAGGSSTVKVPVRVR